MKLNPFAEGHRMAAIGITLFAAAVLCSPIHAQSAPSTADLIGVVKDSEGTRLVGATISAIRTATGARRTAASDERGEYRIASLTPGEYSVTAELIGFGTETYQEIALSVGEYAHLDFELEIAPVQLSITVEGKTYIVEREKTSQAAAIHTFEIDNLPINGRNFLEFVGLTPGVTNENSLDTTTPVTNPTSGLVFAGQDPRSNYVTIDGVDNMDIAQLSVRPTLGQEAVQEFQVSRSNFPAEFGRARAGLVNIVSRSGTNDLRGKLFGFVRNEALDARNPFAFGSGGSPIDPRFERYQWGATAGGPIAKDKTFLFTSIEGLRRKESVFVSFLDDPAIFRSTPSQQRLFDALAATGDPRLRAVSAIFNNPDTGILNTTPSTFPNTLARFRNESGVFPFDSNSVVFSSRIDHQFSPDRRLFGRFNLTDSLSENTKFGGLDGISNGVSRDVRSYSAVLGYTHVYSPSTLHDFRFQFYSHDVKVGVNDPNGPELLISGIAKLGRDFTNPTGYKLPSIQFVDNSQLFRGRHALKFGVDWSHTRASGFADVFLGGQFLFAEALPLALVMDSVLGSGTSSGLASSLPAAVSSSLFDPITSLQAFNFGLPVTYFQGFGNSETSFKANQLALYFQDEWKPLENVTFNFGIRYDVEGNAPRQIANSKAPPFEFTRGFPTDRNNVAPRFAFAYDPANSGKTVVRGGYGMFYQPLNQSLTFASTVLSGQIGQVFLPITGIPGVPATSVDVWQSYLRTGRLDQQTLAALNVRPGETPGVVFPTDINSVNPYSHQASLGIEKELSADWAVDVNYLLNRGLHIVRIRDMNVNRIAEDRFTLPGLDPRFLQVNLIETTGSSIYHGMTASLRKRFENHYSLSVSYTMGKAIDDVDDFTVPVEAHDNSNLRWQRSLSTFDQRHRFVAGGVLQSPQRAARGAGFRHNLLADWTLAPLVTWASGRPFTLLLGFDGNGDSHSESDRPRLQNGGLVGRNTGLGPSFFSADMRLTRKFRGFGDASLEVIGEVFNLFNNVNYSGVNQVAGALPLTEARRKGSAKIPANQPLGFISAFDPRQFQLGVRLSF